MNRRFSNIILVLATTSLLAAGTALAKGPGNGGDGGFGQGKAQAEDHWKHDPAHRMARISERLGLSEQQELALLELFHQHEQDRIGLQEQIQQQFGAEICAQRAAHEQDFLALLTPEQLALHEELQARRQERAGERRRHGSLECPAEG